MVDMTDMPVPHERELLPGVTLIVCPTDRFKVGLVSLSFILPNERAVTPVRTLLFSVLRRGTQHYPTLESVNRRLDELYATPYRVRNTGRGGYQCVGFGADVLGKDYLLDDTDVLGGVLSLMQDMLFHPLTEENGELVSRYIEAERKNTVDAIRSIKNHASAYAMTQFFDHFYEGEPWCHLLCGSEDDVRAITAEQLTSEWQQMLKHAPIRCFYIGNEDEELLACRLRELLAPEFARIGRAEPFVTSVAAPRQPRSEQPVRTCEGELEVGQSHLILGFRTGITLSSPDFYAMMLCHEILGLSPISRLFVHVREAHGLCYSCSSDYHIDRGDVIVCCGIREQNREIAQRAILEQIEVMKTGRFTQAEWEAARKSLGNSYRQLGDSTRALSGFYEMRAILGVNQSIKDCTEGFAAVTREQVVAVAQKLRLDTVYFQRGTGENDEGEEDMDDV